MTKRVRGVGRLAMVAALALLLTGCLKLDMNLQIQPDDTVNGSVVLAVSKEILELTGGSAEDLLGSDTPFPSDLEGVTSEEYDDGEFAGQEFKFDGVPISEFSDPDDPDSLQIVREGDTFRVTGVLDLAEGTTGATGATGAAEFFESAEIRVAVTFPGEVTDANGQIEGNTVTWSPKFGERLELSATGSAIASGGSSSTMTIVLIAVGVVVLLAIVAAVIMSQRKKAAAATAAAATQAEMPVTAAPEVAPPAAPEVAPPAAPMEPPPAPPQDPGSGQVPPPPPPS